MLQNTQKLKNINDLYIPITITEKEEIYPRNLDKNIDEILIKKFQDKLGNKCSKYGYVKKESIKLIDRTIGKINSSHFTGNVIFNVKLEMMVCKPSENDILEVEVIGKNKMGILAQNIPIIVALSKIHNNNHYSLFDSIQKGQKIMIQVIDSKFELNDNEIHVIGKLYENN